MNTYQWHLLKKDPPKKAGQYLVVIDDGDDDCFASVEHYFKKGDYILTRMSDNGTFEERVLDSILNDDLKVFADRDGFYELHSDKFDATWDKTLNNNPHYPVYWAELPPAPLGKIWGRINSAYEEPGDFIVAMDLGHKNPNGKRVIYFMEYADGEGRAVDSYERAMHFTYRSKAEEVASSLVGDDWTVLSVNES
jgi:hypothetical protein